MTQSQKQDWLEVLGLSLALAALAALFIRRPPGETATPQAMAAAAPPSELDLAMQLARRGTMPSAPASPLGPLASPGMQEALSYDPIQVSFDLSALGDNIVVPAAHGYRSAIYEFSIWNTVLQDITIKNGPTVLKALPQFPAQAGYVLSLNQAPHWKLDYNQPFIISLSAGRATGFLKYRPLEY